MQVYSIIGFQTRCISLQRVFRVLPIGCSSYRPSPDLGFAQVYLSGWAEGLGMMGLPHLSLCACRRDSLPLQEGEGRFKSL